MAEEGIPPAMFTFVLGHFDLGFLVSHIIAYHTAAAVIRPPVSLRRSDVTVDVQS